MRWALSLLGVLVCAETPGILSVVDRVTSYHTGLIDALDALADAYAEKGWDATAVTHFKETWTCTLGWNVCLTGAVKDFVLNYFGRSSFHDHNGPLINKIRRLSEVLGEEVAPRTIAKLGEQRRLKVKRAYGAALDFVREARTVFPEGSLRNCVDDLATLLDAEEQWKDTGAAAQKIGCTEKCQDDMMQAFGKAEGVLRLLAERFSGEKAISVPKEEEL
jgi:hypothetical protein